MAVLNKLSFNKVLEMESEEKQMVPLVDILPKNDEFFAVIAVVIVVILAVSLIAIYVPKYLSDAENERK